MTDVPFDPAGGAAPAPSVPIPPVARPDLLTASMLDSLTKTKPWVRLLAVVGFIMTGIITVISLGMAAFGVYTTASKGTEGAVILGMALLYLAMGILYLFPSRFLWRYANAIGEAIAAPRKSFAVEKALRHQKSFWKFAGIFTLVMLLLYIPGILAAIAIPNLLTAMQRAKQKRTMADMRTIATAVEARATDTNEYPAVPVEELEAMLEPKYVQALPALDGWGNKFVYEGGSCSGRRCVEYVIVSPGKDGKLERSPSEWLRVQPSATTAFDDDIVYSNGTWVRYPEGALTPPARGE